MTRIGTPSSGLVPTPLPQGAPAAAVLAELPPGVGNVALGTFLTGTVLERAANGLTLLQTANGVLGLKTTVPLPPGSAVTLQIQTAGAQLQAIVLSVTPQPAGSSPAAPQTAAPAGAPPGPATPTAPAQPASVAMPQPAAPSTITATVIGPSGGPIPTVAAQAAAPQSTPAPTPAQPQTLAPSPNPALAAQASPSPAAPAAPSGPAVTTTPTPPAATAQPATPQTVLPNAQQPSPTVPAAAQAAYQRQLNAVPAAPVPSTPLPTASPQPASPVTVTPPALPAQEAAAAKPLTPDAAPAPLPTGTQVQVRLLPSLQTGQPAPPAPLPEAHAETAAAIVRQAAAASTHANPVIMATVMARTPAGQVILDSAVGRLLASLPRDGHTTEPGARLFLEIVTGERQAAAPRPAPATSGLAALARNWQGLRDAMRQLQESPGQQEAYAALERALPKAGPKLAQQMLSYLEHAQQGVKAWLGETVARALAQTGRGPEQLERDMREMQLARQNAEGEWRMTLVPLLDGQHLRQIRFFERRRKQQEEKRKKEEPARFVVECETSAHGAIQLDGLMHEQRLDLIVRSHDSLPSDMERDILVLFGQTCTSLNLTGQVFFQAVPAFPINPLDDVAQEPVRVSV